MSNHIEICEQCGGRTFLVVLAVPVEVAVTFHDDGSFGFDANRTAAGKRGVQAVRCEACDVDLPLDHEAATVVLTKLFRRA